MAGDVSTLLRCLLGSRPSVRQTPTENGLLVSILVLSAIVMTFGHGGSALSAQVGPQHSEGHVLVKVASGARAQQAIGHASEHAFDRWHVVPVPPGKEPGQMVDDLRKRPGIEEAELDFLVQVDPISTSVPIGAALAVDDPGSALQWHLGAVQADSAWDTSTGDGVVVAVVDSGISQDGEDLDCHTFVAPYNAITQTPGAAAAADDHGHGTHVAGTVAQCTNNGIGVAGVAFDASLMPVKVLGASGSGFLSWIARGIDWARDNGADVINLSLGCVGCSSEMVDDAIDAAVDQGIVVVAASGNQNATSVSFPASHPGVIAVGATDYVGNRSPYSNRGSELDLVAPGGDTSQDANGDGFGDGVLQETFVDDVWDYYFFQGTSMATPHVSGGAALLKAVASGLDSVSVRSILETTAVDRGPVGFDNEYGHGLVQLADALEALTVLDGSAPKWPTPATLSAQQLNAGTVRLSWPDASDDIAVSGYTVFRDGSPVAQTTAAKTSTVVDVASAAEYLFEVRAMDLAGNASAPLTLEWTAPDTSAPSWTGTARIDVEEYGERQLDLSWSAANDEVGVSGYRIRVSGTSGVTSSDSAATLSGLEPGRPYLFEVLARDWAGNWSEPLIHTLNTAREFKDAIDHLFYPDILWMSGTNITRGCNPPANDRFCPDDQVTRGQMAAFLSRALGLTADDQREFVDVQSGSVFADDIGQLATAGITRGCNPPANDRFCPDDPVTRAQMAAFVVRALELVANEHPGYRDVPIESTFVDDIGRLATVGITRGCNPPANDRYCPEDPITRGQLAAFLRRAFQN